MQAVASATPGARALASARDGRPFGSGFTKLVQVAHNLADNHKGTLRAFGHALNVYGSMPIIRAEDVTRQWYRKAMSIRQAMSDGDPAYAPDQAWNAALKFLFPEIADKIRMESHADTHA